MNDNGFKRAAGMFAAIRAALAITSPDKRQLALMQIDPYFSRGKGRGGFSYANGRGSRGGNNAGRGHPHQNDHEKAKRKRNIARGLQSRGTILLAHQRRAA